MAYTQIFAFTMHGIQNRGYEWVKCMEPDWLNLYRCIVFQFCCPSQFENKLKILFEPIHLPRNPNDPPPLSVEFDRDIWLVPVVYFSTYAYPLISISDLRQIRYTTHILPTSTWAYSCDMDLWPQRPAPSLS